MIKIVVILLATAFGRNIRRAVELYSMSGRHVTITGSSLGSTWSTNSDFAQLDFVPIEKGHFLIRGIKSGKYIQSKGRRLRLTTDPVKAARFHEEMMDNKFNKYVTDNDKVLRITSKGKLRIRSNTKNGRSISFLPRKTHVKRHFSTGQRL